MSVELLEWSKVKIMWEVLLAFSSPVSFSLWSNAVELDVVEGDGEEEEELGEWEECPCVDGIVRFGGDWRDIPLEIVEVGDGTVF